jgi:hypothetical protein
VAEARVEAVEGSVIGDEERSLAEDVLAEGLNKSLGRAVEVTAVTWVAEPQESSHPIDRLRVGLRSGDVLSVVFKRLRPTSADADLARHRKGGPREVLVYRSLLSRGRLGAPLLYASRHDPGRGHFWIFLEDVGQETLETASTDAWRASVVWLAGMHGAYLGREHDLRNMTFLPEAQTDGLHHLAGIARCNLVSADCPEIDRFDDVVAVLRSAPLFLDRQLRTLLHGDIFTHNLAVQPGPRIRPLDWEQACIGWGAWDLARLLDGWESEERENLLDLYLHTIAGRASGPFDREAFLRMLDWCELLSELSHLGWHPEQCTDRAFVRGILNTLELKGELFRRGAVRA